MSKPEPALGAPRTTLFKASFVTEADCFLTDKDIVDTRTKIYGAILGAFVLTGISAWAVTSQVGTPQNPNWSDVASSVSVNEDGEITQVISDYYLRYEDGYSKDDVTYVIRLFQTMPNAPGIAFDGEAEVEGVRYPVRSFLNAQPTFEDLTGVIEFYNEHLATPDNHEQLQTSSIANLVSGWVHDKLRAAQDDGLFPSPTYATTGTVTGIPVNLEALEAWKNNVPAWQINNEIQHSYAEGENFSYLFYCQGYEVSSPQFEELIAKAKPLLPEESFTFETDMLRDHVWVKTEIPCDITKDVPANHPAPPTEAPPQVPTPPVDDTQA